MDSDGEDEVRITLYDILFWFLDLYAIVKNVYTASPDQERVDRLRNEASVIRIANKILDKKAMIENFVGRDDEINENSILIVQRVLADCHSIQYSMYNNHKNFSPDDMLVIGKAFRLGVRFARAMLSRYKGPKTCLKCGGVISEVFHVK